MLLRRLGGPEVLEVAEVPDPVPGARELLVRVEATSINRRDLLMRAGHPHPAYRVPLPGILGLDLCGHVVDAGSEVEGFGTGDRITVNPYMPCGRCAYCRVERSQTREDALACIQHLDSGRLQPLVAETLVLEQVAKGHRMLQGGEVAGKVVVRVAG
ncbi:MAG: alcohol dehydrogenase catalytic domain-containing protein [Solirubrobacteraceae bacterium]